jgi:tRNA-splicing ligase RtcB (3'-phosphate/5'-hydroxy nucleic acid ligase)
MISEINTERIPIKLWTDDIEPGALDQARDLANLPFARKWIAIMPDCHRGYGMPIGGVLATEGVVVPNAVGVDIGCGMIAQRLSIEEIERGLLKEIVAGIRRAIPLGFDHHEQPQRWPGFDQAPDLAVIQRELRNARYQLGTLGGGNHFIEIQRGDDGHIWLMLHSGSRNFGLKIANEYHQKARRHSAASGIRLPTSDLSFLPLDSRDGREYIAAMQFALEFAQASRAAMMETVAGLVCERSAAAVLDTVNIHHNFAAIERHFGSELVLHRKGATKASKGLRGIVPGSMGSPSYIVEGLGNPASFCSCSHGAGRRMGRRAAQRELDLAVEQGRLAGIVHGLRSRSGLDEAPGAYKDIAAVMRNQSDLVRILVELTPLAVVKG